MHGVYYSLTLITIAQLSPEVLGPVIAVSLLVVIVGVILVVGCTVYIRKRDSQSLSYGVETVELEGR